MTWLPICLFLVLFAHNAKLESQFINRLPREVNSTTPTSTTPTSTTPTSTTPSTGPTSTTPSTGPASTTPSTGPTSTTPSTGPTSTTPSTGPTSTTPSTGPTSTTPSTGPASTTESPKENKKDGDECDADSLNNMVCENDKLTFCGPNNLIMSVPCVVKGRPGFCNCEKTGCVAKKPVCPNDKTKCYEPNTKLPDNLDCHKFTYCNEKEEKVTFQCKGNLIYDITEEKCKDHIRCHKVACPRAGKGLQLIPFPQAKNYYVLCYNGVGDVRKCPNKYYAAKNNACQFDCNLIKTSGIFKDTNLENCRKGYYYACKRSGSHYITYPEKCEKGLTFDDDLGICTEEDTCTEPESENN